MDRRRWRTGLASAVLVAATIAGSVPGPAGAAPPPGDFDSGGVVWVPKRSAAYAITRNTPVFPFTIPGQGATAVPIAGAFTGDGLSDVLLYNPGSGPDTLLDVQEQGGYYRLEYESETITGTYTPIVGDFDANGLDDVFWYGPGSTPDSIWLFRADGTHAVVPTTITGTYRTAVMDTDADGRDDIIWHAPGGAADSIWRFGPGATTHTVRWITLDGTYRMIPGRFGARPAGTPQERLVLASATGPDSMWTFDAQGAPSSRRLTIPITGTPTPLVGHLRQPDLDAILWYRPGTAAETWWTFEADGTPQQTEASPVDGTYLPVVADLNGDLLDDVVWSTNRTAIAWLMRDDGGHTTTTLRHDLSDVVPIAITGD